MAFLSCIFPIYSGLKGQYILGSIYQPSIYGVFLLPALFYYLKGKNFKSLFCLFIATSFHPSLIFTTSIIGIIFLCNLKNNTQKIFFLVSGVLILFPIALCVYTNIYDSKFSDLASDILVTYRIPHHADLTFLSYLDVARLLILGLSIFFCRDILLKKILITASALIVFFILLANILDSNSFNLLFPIRISILFVPIAVAIVSVEIFLILKSYLINHISERKVLFTCTLLVFLSVFINSVSIISNKKINPYFDWTPYTSPDMVWLTPLSDPSYFIEGIRLNLSQPIFVDYKSHPINSKDIIEWKDRIDLSQRFYMSENKNEQEFVFKEISEISKIKYILAGNSDNYFIDSEIIFKSDNMTLFKVH